jgi:hypothetical protein
VPNVLRFDFFFQIGEDNFAKCRFFQQYSGAAPTSAALSTQANNVGALYSSSGMSGNLHTSNSLQKITITDLSSPSAGVGVSTFVPITGNRVGAELPGNTAVLESREIARRYRGGHSRIYWPFGVQADLHDEQTWSPAAVGNFSTALANFQSGLGATFPGGTTLVGPVNVSYYFGATPHTGTTGRVRMVNTPRVTPLVDAVLSAIVRVGVATIRKRLLGLA